MVVVAAVAGGCAADCDGRRNSRGGLFGGGGGLYGAAAGRLGAGGGAPEDEEEEEEARVGGGCCVGGCGGATNAGGGSSLTTAPLLVAVAADCCFIAVAHAGGSLFAAGAEVGGAEVGGACDGWTLRRTLCGGGCVTTCDEDDEDACFSRAAARAWTPDALRAGADGAVGFSGGVELDGARIVYCAVVVAAAGACTTYCSRVYGMGCGFLGDGGCQTRCSERAAGQTFSSARGSGGSEPGIIGEMLLRWPGKSPRSPRSSAPTSVANSSAGGCAGWPERGLSGSAREGEREGVSAIECVF